MAVGRVRAVLGLNRAKFSTLVPRSKAIHTGLEANQGVFNDPNPPLPELLLQIQDFEKAQQLVGTRVAGASALRAQKRDVLLSSLECERMYVQSLCDASPEQAASLIALAAMRVASVRAYAKPLLLARTGMPSGTVVLEANAGLLEPSRRARYFNWQYTIDGKSFITMPPTPGARTTLAGLVPLTTVGFRVSITVLGQPPAEWSQVVTILVL